MLSQIITRKKHLLTAPEGGIGVHTGKRTRREAGVMIPTGTTQQRGLDRLTRAILRACRNDIRSRKAAIFIRRKPPNMEALQRGTMFGCDSIHSCAYVTRGQGLLAVRKQYKRKSTHFQRKRYRLQDNIVSRDNFVQRTMPADVSTRLFEFMPFR